MMRLFFKFNMFLSVIFFSYSFFSVAQENGSITSCKDLTSPQNQTEVNELLLCLRNLNRERKSQKNIKKIQSKYKSSEQLSGQINSSSLGSGIKGNSPDKLSGTYPGSVNLSNQVQSSLPGSGSNNSNPPGSGNSFSGNSGIYPGSFQLTQRILKRSPSSGGKNPASIIESNPELRGPKSYSESKNVSQNIKSRLD